MKKAVAWTARTSPARGAGLAAEALTIQQELFATLYRAGLRGPRAMSRARGGALRAPGSLQPESRAGLQARLLRRRLRGSGAHGQCRGVHSLRQ
jgi:hypothetical protein